jgi:pyridoxal phosphate enzyme (YggS family)
MRRVLGARRDGASTRRPAPKAIRRGMIDAERVRRRLGEVREEIAAAAARSGRDPAGVEVLAATKYVSVDELPQLAQAGVRLVGENKAQDLEAKTRAQGELFIWDFIGQLQSRRVALIVPHVRLVHSVASTSALRALGGCLEQTRAEPRILVQVNVAREERKAGVAPEQLDAFIESSPVRVEGLMTMPPMSADPERSRPWFAALRELAGARGLPRLSMGTSQDYLVAVEEGATIVRLGSRLYS